KRLWLQWNERARDRGGGTSLCIGSKRGVRGSRATRACIVAVGTKREGSRGADSQSCAISRSTSGTHAGGRLLHGGNRSDTFQPPVGASRNDARNIHRPSRCTDARGVAAQLPSW